MNKRVSIAATLSLAAIGIGAAFLFATMGAGTLIEANVSYPKISFSSDKNRLYESGGGSGTSYIHTELGSPVSVEYSGFSSDLPNSAWHTLDAGGSFSNIDKITGLSHITFGVVGSGTVDVSWSKDRSSFAPEDIESVSVVEGTSSLCYFDNDFPCYLRFENKGSSSLTISSMEISFTCKEDPDPTLGLEYTLNDDGVSYSLTGIGTATSTDIVISPAYNGYPVTEIGISAFEENTSITSVHIPDSVVIVNSFAFDTCTSLSSVRMSNNAVKIDSFAFAYDSLIPSIMLPDTLTDIGNFTFHECSSLSKVYYGGTSSTWENIRKGSSNMKLANATRYYFTSNGAGETGTGYWWYYDPSGNIVEKVVG